MKLTETQTELLREACRDGGTYCVRHYSPGVALVKKGLASWCPATDRLVATEAGRAALRETK